MFKMINKIDSMMQDWEKLSPADKQAYAIMAGASAGLIIRGLLKMKQSKKEMEIVKLVVPKDAELFIFVKGGK